MFEFLDSMENNLSNGMVPLTDLGFNVLGISPLLTPECYDSSGNYTYQYSENQSTLMGAKMLLNMATPKLALASLPESNLTTSKASSKASSKKTTKK